MPHPYDPYLSPRWLLLLVPALFGLVVIGGCGSEAQSKPSEGEEDERVAVPVEAAAAMRGDVSAFYTGTATLEAEDEAVVVAKASGVVEEVLHEEGDYVEAGEPLARLEHARLALELARIEANFRKAERAYERTQELRERDLISQEEFERVRSELETQQAAYDIARLDVEYATVRAPIAGIISERLVKAGNMVRENEPTFHITDFDPLLAVIHVPERELNKLRTGQQAELTVDALPLEVFTGRIKRISPVVDPNTGTFKTTVEVRDPSRRLKPGLFGRVRIVYDTRADALLVPAAALVSEDDEDALFVVVNDTLALRRPVAVGYRNEREVEILDGLDAGVAVVTTGQASLRDSARVEVVRQ